MMSGAKLDVVWSPVHPDKFVLWGSDITLYEVAALKDIENKSTCVKISSTSGATVLASQSAVGVRCIDVSSIAALPDPLLALGHTSGRVSLTSLGQNVDCNEYIGREFVPRYSRLCNSVSWSPVETNLVAAALDKHRSDHCIVLWDVNRAGGTSTSSSDSPSSGGAGGTDQGGPLAEMGLSETAHAVSWTHAAPRTLLASMNMRYIKVFDLRDLSNKAVQVATSRHCSGVCADPHNAWQLASRGDNVICVWDCRSFDKPLLTLNQQRPLAKIQWCPTRRNLLCSVQRDASRLRLHDIQQAHAHHAAPSGAPAPAPGGTGAPAAAPAPGDAPLQGDSVWSMEGSSSPGPASAAAAAAAAAAVEAGPAQGAGAEGGGAGVVERALAGGAQALSGFCWHPERAAILAVALSGALVEYQVLERVTLSWAATGRLAWAGGGGARRLDPPAAAQDTAARLRARATTPYGLKADLWENAELADDEALSNLWHFLALSKSLVEDGCIRNSEWRIPGVLTVTGAGGAAAGSAAAAGGAAGGGATVGGGAAGYRSQAVPSLLPDMPNRRITIYRSGWRSWALQLCGWGWGWEQAGAGVERAEASGDSARAAALAAFHLRLRTALAVLQRAPDPALRLAALALAGLGEERVWQETAEAAATSLPGPYARALLHFLCATSVASAAPLSPPPPNDHHLAAVLYETEMRLEDRVAFACIFLSDSKLHEYLRELADAHVERGDLAGILLTGMSPQGLTLLQRWVDRSGDVQSAALLAARALQPELAQDPRPRHWLDSYRSLLDSWKMWWARCSLDTWASSGGGGGASRQVCVACGYCGKSVAAPPGHARPRPARLPPPTANMKQISSCPHCRKPLPRCAVCCLHLGTAAGGGGAGAGGGGAGGGAHFAGWFSWCVACRHGGHARHMQEWFKEHTECPVSSCSCRCSTLDPPDRT